VRRNKSCVIKDGGERGSVFIPHQRDRSEVQKGVLGGTRKRPWLRIKGSILIENRGAGKGTAFRCQDGTDNKR